MTDNTPNAGQVAIGGAFGFDSIFLVDGVDTNDNLFGASNTLFIEDAIQETPVLTSGISAEYRSVCRRRGERDHQERWQQLPWLLPHQLRQALVDRRDALRAIAEPATLRPVVAVLRGDHRRADVRDRLWFFNANRYEDSQTGNVLAEVGTPFDTGNNNKRFELKLTGTLAPTQTVWGSYLNNPRTQTNLASINTQMSMDPATLIDAETPNDLWVVNWQGVLTPSLFGTFQYSRKEWTSIAGGTSTAITDSPFISRGVVSGVPANRHYNAAYFSANDPEDRNNQQFAGSLSYFTTNRGSGRHDLKGGLRALHLEPHRRGLTDVDGVPCSTLITCSAPTAGQCWTRSDIRPRSLEATPANPAAAATQRHQLDLRTRFADRHQDPLLVRSGQVDGRPSSDLRSRLAV